ncbi:hypothetical protein SAMN05421504_103489 [Amycolatopsis xylanica]|uniref:Peptidase inhibitor family I36 n=1 Tax=Amycolatopsis xylanica TaxID=589385 RepID=A0A1H3DS53_9PSEU|nr:hypothetical protein [Amycolatopsis xylanica]SDX68938.1 hypothetical protein SAMN05421504_103489 [Amycolatopsis xylanica]
MSRVSRAGLAMASAVAGLALATAPAQAATQSVTQTQINQCGWLPIPAGWIDTGHFYSGACGSSITLNTFVLVQGSSVPVGSQLTMCATTQYQPPAGWNIVSGLFNQPSCATFSPTLDKNAYRVQRFS